MPGGEGVRLGAQPGCAGRPPPRRGQDRRPAYQPSSSQDSPRIGSKVGRRHRRIAPVDCHQSMRCSLVFSRIAINPGQRWAAVLVGLDDIAEHVPACRVVGVLTRQFIGPRATAKESGLGKVV